MIPHILFELSKAVAFGWTKQTFFSISQPKIVETTFRAGCQGTCFRTLFWEKSFFWRPVLLFYAIVTDRIKINGKKTLGTAELYIDTNVHSYISWCEEKGIASSNILTIISYLHTAIAIICSAWANKRITCCNCRIKLQLAAVTFPWRNVVGRAAVGTSPSGQPEIRFRYAADRWRRAPSPQVGGPKLQESLGLY